MATVALLITLQIFCNFDNYKSCNFGVYIMQGLGVKEYIAIVAGQIGMLAAKSIPATMIFYYVFVYICDVQIITLKSEKI